MYLLWCDSFFLFYSDSFVLAGFYRISSANNVVLIWKHGSYKPRDPHGADTCMCACINVWIYMWIYVCPVVLLLPKMLTIGALVHTWCVSVFMSQSKKLPYHAVCQNVEWDSPRESSLNRISHFDFYFSVTFLSDSRGKQTLNFHAKVLWWCVWKIMQLYQIIFALS